MRAIRLSLLVPLLLLLVAASAGISRADPTFNPTFSLAVSSDEVGRNADVTITITQTAGQEFFDVVSVEAPPGWDFNQGSSIAGGAVVGTGFVSFVYGTPSDSWLQLVNQSYTQGHKAHWTLRSAGPYCCLEVFLDGSTELGHEFTIDPQTVDTPFESSLTILGTVNGTAIISNPALPGDYTWSAVFRSPSGMMVTRSVAVPIATTTAVGGIIELRRGTSALSAHQPGTSAPPYAAIAGGVAVAVLLVTAGARYARRRWGR